jgi:hypothetical protein
MNFLTFPFENIEDERIGSNKKNEIWHRHLSINIYLESVEQDVVTR